MISHILFKYPWPANRFLLFLKEETHPFWSGFIINPTTSLLQQKMRTVKEHQAHKQAKPRNELLKDPANPASVNNYRR